MEAKPSPPSFGEDERHLLAPWVRVYLHGCIAFVVLYAAAYVVSRLAPIFDFVGSPGLAIILSVLTILIAPPLMGSIVLFGVLPMLGKRESLKGLAAWDDRLISTLAGARRKVQIVILNWPSVEVRTMGVLTATFKANDSEKELASVYLPTAPHTRFGYIRIVSLEDVEFTDWTLKQWQMYQLTFGAISPERLRDNIEGGSE